MLKYFQETCPLANKINLKKMTLRIRKDDILMPCSPDMVCLFNVFFLVKIGPFHLFSFSEVVEH